MTDYAEFRRRDLRLTILKSLAKHPAFTANEKILQLEAGEFGLHFTREAVRTEIRFLDNLGALTVTEAGSVLVATLKQRGVEHIRGLLELDGVDPPSPER